MLLEPRENGLQAMTFLEDTERDVTGSQTESCVTVRFCSKGNPLQVCSRSCHVLAMQRFLFKNQLDDLYFSYNKPFFLQGTLDGLPFE